jgi:hypothetical protein
MLAYWFILMAFLGGVVAVVVVTNFLKIKDLASQFGGSRSFPGDMLAGWLAHSILYLVAMVFVMMLFVTLLAVLQSAGMGRMFARAATEGKTGMGDFFEGIGTFTGRTFSIAMLKGGIIMLPMLAVSVLMLIVALMIRGDNALPAMIALLVLGTLGTIAASAVVGFLTWMWKPAVFIRNIGALEGLAASYKFVTKRLGGVIIILLMWIAFGMVIGMPSSIAQMFVNPAFVGQHQTPAYGVTMVMFFAGIQFVTIIIRTLGMIFFVLMYYKYYADEWQNLDAPPAPAGVWRPGAAQSHFIANPQSLQGLRPEQIYQPPQPQEPAQPEPPPEGDAPPADTNSEPEPDPTPKPGLPDGFA